MFCDRTTRFRRQAIEAAKDLCYGDAVIKALKTADSVGEMDRIMKKARHEMFDKED
jgi:hypothetical protein